MMGQDHAKANALAARCTVGDMVNGRGRILSHQNLQNQSKSCFHSFVVSSEARELLLKEFHFRDLIIPHVWCSILTYYNL
jgi:hypothetical protein